MNKKNNEPSSHITIILIITNHQPPSPSFEQFPQPASTIASFVALEVGAMEAKMLQAAVSSKPKTKHRDGERSAVKTLDRTCC